MMETFRRISSLVRKEYNQLIRDRSSLVIGIVIPIMLILLIGYGLSLDVKNVPVAVVMRTRLPRCRICFLLWTAPTISIPAIPRL